MNFTFFLNTWTLMLVCLILTGVTLFSIGLFGAADRWGGGKKEPIPKICHIFPTMTKLIPS